MQNEIHCNFFRWNDEEKEEAKCVDEEVRKPDYVIMKMWQELAIKSSREIEKLQCKLDEVKLKLEEENLKMPAEKSTVVAVSVKVAAERSKMKLAMVLVVLFWAIITGLIFSNVY